MYVKFNVHSSYGKQVIVLKVVDRQTDGRTDTPHDDNGLRPKKPMAFKELNKQPFQPLYLIEPSQSY